MYNKAIPALGAILLVGSAAAWYWWPHLAPTPTPPPPVVAPLPEAAPAIANPMPAADATAAAMPALAASDKPFAKELTGIPGAGALGKYLQPQNLIRHIVATVDNLPRHKLAVDLLPIHGTAGKFTVSGNEEQATLDAHNTLRYGPLVAILGSLDMRAVNRLYQNYYPLFQRAYQDQGYPQGYFNDRLVAVIDNLLATPKPTGPVALVRPKVFWEYADPDLEARSAGQKLMLRIGTDNAAVVERKLRELRALIATGAPKSANH
ncbi:MAG: DUF3014 domain-containing protein [Steroidobacteraceae bacterium]